MTEPRRVTPEEIYSTVHSGETLLVCAYESDARFQQVRLEGAISLGEFKALLPTLPKDREIVFYCAWPHEATAAGQAAALLKMGYPNAKALKGGVDAWQQAGYAMVR
jgi:rhodanese-related sulfurtransferase